MNSAAVGTIAYCCAHSHCSRLLLLLLPESSSMKHDNLLLLLVFVVFVFITMIMSGGRS